MKFHKNAKLNAYQRAQIRTSKLSNKQLAAFFGVHERTIRRWRKRLDVEDRSHRPKNIKYAFSDIERDAFLTERTNTFAALDEIIEQMELRFGRRFARSTVYVLFKRHGLARKPRAKKEKPGTFPDCNPGFLHIDVTEVPVIGKTKTKNFLYVAIDRKTRYTWYKRYDRQNQANTMDFFEKCLKEFPFKVYSVVTDNGKEFTNSWIRPTGSAKGKKVIDSHLTRYCKANGIKHILTKPYHPQTNGMVERVNRTIKEGTIYQYRYNSDEEFNQHLDVFLNIYNTKRRHSGLIKELGVRTPLEAIKKLAA